jgi:hypothetical protein
MLSNSFKRKHYEREIVQLADRKIKIVSQSMENGSETFTYF